jgi:ABC-2 type transport system permease protein
MNVSAAIIGLTLRALVGRRRTIGILLLNAVPILVSLVTRIGGRGEGEVAVIESLVVPLVLPLTALLMGTAALGSEIEDGTIVYLVAKPVPRRQIVLAKLIAAGGLTAALTATSTLLAGVLAGGVGALGPTIAYTIAIAVAGIAYCALFVALSVLSTRAMLIGLIYVIVWEGLLAGILEGTRIFSIREATMSLANALGPARSGIGGDLDGVSAVVIVGVAVVGGFLVGAYRLGGYEVSGTD